MDIALRLKRIVSMKLRGEISTEQFSSDRKILLNAYRTINNKATCSLNTQTKSNFE